MNDKFKSHLPLLVLTASAIVSASLICGSLISFLLTAEISSLQVFASLIIMVIGMVFSLNHIHQKQNLSRFFNGFKHSLLSIESILLNIFLFSVAFLSVAIIFNFSDYLNFILYFATVSGVLLVFIIGQLYNLESQKTWYGVVNSTYPLLNLVLLSFISSGASDKIEFIKQLVFGFLLLDLITAYLRQKKSDAIFEQFKKINYPADNKFIKILYFCRAVLSVCLFALFIDNYATLIFSAYILVVIIDRVIYYLSGVQKSPELSVQTERSKRLKYDKGFVNK